MTRLKPQGNTFGKRIFMVLSIALGCITLTGCSVDDRSVIELPDEAVAVSFHAALESETQARGTSMDLVALQNESFGVLAYYTNGYSWSNAFTPNFMYNQKVNWQTDQWVYTPVKYWPIVSGDKVSFFAYAPYDDQNAGTAADNHGIALSGNAVTGAPVIDFTVNRDSIAGQVDLLYASAIDKNKEQVDLPFHHALSRIGFSAKTAADFGDNEVKVTAVSINGTFYPSGSFNLGEGAWSGKNATTDSTTYAPRLNASALAIDTTAQSIHDADQYLMLIPQEFTDESNRCTIEATYTIGGSAKTATTEIDLSFEQSKAYNITLVISIEDAEPGITITVTPWNTVNIQREFKDFIISTTAAWAPPSREIPDLATSVRFAFTMIQPVGATWKATLSNGLDFALDDTYAISGSSGLSYNVGVKALKPAGRSDRNTEFYLTIDGKEVDTNGDGETGPGHRYRITQKAAE